EVGMQNAGLGVALAVNQFPDNPQASVAPAVYVFLCMLTGTLLAAYWRNFAPIDEEDNPSNNEVYAQDKASHD
ncbi:MAG: putative Na+-dependent transporter, partial [Pirellulaceae bacterium]